MSGLLKQLEKKRSIVLILMSLAVVLMLSGCSGTEEESRPASSGEEEAYTLETKVEDVRLWETDLPGGPDDRR